MKRVVVTLGWLWLGSACAPSLPDAYAQHVDAAQRAYQQGRYEEAARHWQEAKGDAETEHDRTEAQYRAAVSLLRAGRTAEARRLLGEVVETGKGSRVARAAFHLADLEIDDDNPGPGYAMLRRTILRFPNDGVARNALRRYGTFVAKTKGPEAAERELLQLAKKLAGAELESTALFERAKQLEARGRDEAALRAFSDVLERFPYPQGVYWEDATLRAAQLSRKLGDERRARKLLLAMLQRRESSSVTGSYERSYDQAAFLLAELELDAGKWRAARDRFRSLYQSFPHSRLRDDALWWAARLSHENGDPETACAISRELGDELPDSRYAPCTPQLCPGLRAQGRCADYILRELHTPR